MQSKGFTLVELVVVILILGILAAFALPKFFNPGDYQNRAAYDELAGAVRYARKLAVAGGCPVRVRILANGYAVEQQDGGCGAGTWQVLTGHPVGQRTFNGVYVASTAAVFQFGAMGRCSASPTITVGSETFNVVAETGYVDAP